jgi:autotransporter-associated beta strand protein
MHQLIKLFCFLSLAVLLAATPQPTQAATSRTWLPNGSGADPTAFNDLLNWTPGTPGWASGDSVTINTNTGNIATISADGPVTLGAVNLGTTASAKLIQNSGTVSFNGQFTAGVVGASYYTMTGGTLIQTGSGAGQSNWSWMDNANVDFHWLLSGDAHFEQTVGGSSYIFMGIGSISGTPLKAVNTIEMSGTSSMHLSSLYMGYRGACALNLTENASVIHESNTASTDPMPFLGYLAESYPELNITGHATFTSNNTNRNIAVAVGGLQGTSNHLNGVLTVSDHGQFIASSRPIEVNGRGCVNVGVTEGATGGTIVTPGFSGGATLDGADFGTVNFHGGTVKANADSSDFMVGSARAYVYSLGATIDTDTHNITINKTLETPDLSNGVTDIAVASGSGYKVAPLVLITPAEGDVGWGATAKAVLGTGADAGKIVDVQITNPGTGYFAAPTVTLLGWDCTSAASATATVGANAGGGGLTKKGLGTLTLSAGNTYTGNTSVAEGTLSVTGSLAGNASVSKGATLGGNGSIYGAVTVLGDDAGGGTINPGTSIGTIYLGSLKLQKNSNLHFEIDSTGNDQIAVNGGDVVEDPATTPVTVNVSWMGSSTSPVTLLSVDSTHYFDPNNKITFNWLKPTLDSSDGQNSALATPEIVRGLGGYMKLNPAGAITDPAWNNVLGGSWQTSTKWGPPNNVPDAGNERAMFTKNFSVLVPTVIPITLDADTEISSMIFNNPSGYGPTGESYAISGNKTITLNSSIATDWHITVLGGEHAVNTKIKIAQGTNQSIVRLADYSQLTLGGEISDMMLVPATPSNLNFKGNFNNGAYDGMGTGKLTLAGANKYTGKTTVESGVLELKSLGNVDVPNTLGMSSALPANFTLKNCTLQYSGPNGQLTNRGITLDGDVTFQMDNSAFFSGQIASTATTVLKNGMGTLTLNNATSGQTNAIGETFRIVSGTAAFSGGAAETSYATTYVQIGDNDNAVLKIGESANLSAYTVHIGGYATTGVFYGVGAMYQSGGAVSVLATGTGIGGYGYHQLSGGEIQWCVGGSNFHWTGYNDTGIYEQTSGTSSCEQPSYGSIVGGNITASSSATGVMNITGGLYQLNNTNPQQGLVLGYSTGSAAATGIVNLGGTDPDHPAVMDLKGPGTVNGQCVVGYDTGRGILNLGGTSQLINVGFVKPLVGAVGTGLINFHGGTLQAAESTDIWNTDPNEQISFMDGLAHAYIYPKGAKIKVEAGHSSQINQVFEDPTGNGLTTASISITNGGSGYVAPPLVTFNGSGDGATAIATIDSAGRVNGIIITNPGTGYAFAPDIYLTGGGGINATASANPAQFVANAGGDLQKLGDGELFLNAANTYTGKTLVKGGTLKIADVQNGGTASPIGKSLSDPENLVLDGGVLYYSGLAKTTDRGFTVGPGGGTVKTDHHLTFTGNVAEGDDGGLTKDGEGTLTLTGNLIYTDATDIKAGLLEIGHTADPVDLPGGITSSTGAGDLTVLDGTALTTPSIKVNSLIIGGSSVSPAPPAPVPEPGTWLLLAMAGLGALSAARRRKS